MDAVLGPTLEAVEEDINFTAEGTRSTTFSWADMTLPLLKTRMEATDIDGVLPTISSACQMLLQHIIAVCKVCDGQSKGTVHYRYRNSLSLALPPPLSLAVRPFHKPSQLSL